MAKIDKKADGTRCHYTDWLPVDVLTAAKQRIKLILNLHDTVAVCFSGGKDSLAALHLVKEVYDESGIVKPINVIFRDEELIPDVVVDFMESYHTLPWIKLWWFAIPLKSTKYILGKTHDMVQWDPHRPHVRPKPSWAIVDDGVVLDQYTADAYIANHCGFRGKVCFITGIRAQESLVRFRAIVNVKGNPVVAATSEKRISMGRLIYDWSENDIFRYFYDRKISYCPIYDWQTFNGENLRVATPLFVESAKRLWTLKTRDPEFYDRLLRIFPEVGVQAMYYRDMDRHSLFAKYEEDGYEGVLQYIRENITDPVQRRLAIKRYDMVMLMAEKAPHAYSPHHILKAFVSGAFKREIFPMTKAEQARVKK